MPSALALPRITGQAFPAGWLFETVWYKEAAYKLPWCIRVFPAYRGRNNERNRPAQDDHQKY